MSFEQTNPFALPNAGGSPLTETSMFCGVTTDANGNAVLPSAGGNIVGVMTSIDGTGSAVRIKGIGGGIQKLLYGGTVTLPAMLKVNSAGAFVTATASDIASGSACAVAIISGSSGDIGMGVLIGGGGGADAMGGYEDVVLASATPVSGITLVSYLETTGTVSGALPDGLFPGQMKEIVQSVAATSPIGTVTGHFETWAAVSEGTLNLGTAVGDIVRLIWTGAKWRQVSAFGGTGASLST